MSAHTFRTVYGSLRVATLSRVAFQRASDNPDAPDGAGRPAWAALATVIGDDADRFVDVNLLDIEAQIESYMAAENAPASVELEYHPAAGGLWLIDRRAHGHAVELICL